MKVLKLAMVLALCLNKCDISATAEKSEQSLEFEFVKNESIVAMRIPEKNKHGEPKPKTVRLHEGKYLDKTCQMTARRHKTWSTLSSEEGKFSKSCPKKEKLLSSTFL